jgi:hypothetical protein
MHAMSCYHPLNSVIVAQAARISIFAFPVMQNMSTAKIVMNLKSQTLQMQCQRALCASLMFTFETHSRCHLWLFPSAA